MEACLRRHIDDLVVIIAYSLDRFETEEVEVGHLSVIEAARDEPRKFREVVQLWPKKTSLSMASNSLCEVLLWH